MKFFNASWIFDLHNHMQGESGTIVKRFEEVGIAEAINDAQAIHEKVENPNYFFVNV